MLINRLSLKMHDTQSNNFTHDIMSYPFTLTPPSSSEDSPQSFSMHSPNYFQLPMSTNLQSYIISQASQYDVPMTNLYSPDRKPPYLIITEQPIDKFRFRYKSEMAGTHGSLTGINSDKTRKQTYPTVKLNNYFGHEVIIRCSLYQHASSDARQPHAHRLIKKHGHDELDDPHNISVTKEDNYEVSFHSMGIIHTAKKHIVGELKRKKTLLKLEEIARSEKLKRQLTTKEEVEIGTSAEEECKSINLNIVCLRFDAFEKKGDILYPICKPIYSHAINNLKSALTGELKIVRMDHSSSPAKGNREIFMLVEKVTKKNIKIRFFETDEGDNEIWSDYGKFNDLDVHHQYAIVFRTPPYRELDIGEQRKVFIELERPSDGSKSEPREFTYTPSQHYKTGMKRPRTSMYTSSEFSSNSLNSTELPTTVEALENIQGGGVTSAELEAALPHIDSEEFNKLIEANWSEFTGLGGEHHEPQISITFDKTNSKKQSSNTEEKDKQILTRVNEEFRNFMKTEPKREHIISMLTSLFTKYVNDAKENALHITVLEGDLKMLRNWLRTIEPYKQYHILNMQNASGETVVHLALQRQNLDIITTLLTFPCDLSIKDNNGNTPLHVALIQSQSNLIIDTLLRSPYGKDLFINEENHDNLTALHMAIKMNKPKYVEILYKHRANVNLIDKKTGRNSLHIAITEQAVDIVRLLLEKTDIDLLKEDFGGNTPLKMAKHLIQDKEPERIQIFNMIEKVLISRGLHSEYIVKEELESEEEMEFDMVECKIEKLSLDELEPMYKTITNFTSTCLDQISMLLDKSGNWMALANLLDLEHIIHTDMFIKAKSRSRELLQIAVRLNDLLNIRKFLDDLGELEAVSLMDNMVMSTKMETKLTFFPETEKAQWWTNVPTTPGWVVIKSIAGPLWGRASLKNALPDAANKNIAIKL